MKLIIIITTFLSLQINLLAQSSQNIKLENYFGDLRARHIGPAVMSGRINDLEIHPKSES